MLASVSKAAAAFVALFVTNLLANLTATGFVWPTTTKGWLTFVLTTLLGTLAVWAKSNITTNPTVAASQSVKLKSV